MRHTRRLTRNRSLEGTSIGSVDGPVLEPQIEPEGLRMDQDIEPRIQQAIRQKAALVMKEIEASDLPRQEKIQQMRKLRQKVMQAANPSSENGETSVNGSASGARTLWTDAGNCIARMTRATIEIDAKLKTLGMTYRDEEYQEFADSIKTVFKRLHDMIDDLKTIQPELEHYASILDQAKMRE